MKCHDWQVIVEHLWPVLFGGVFRGEQQLLLNDLFTLLGELCARKTAVAGLPLLKTRIALWLARAEHLMPLTELAIVMHLMVHMPDEIARWGPVRFFWMYPIERYACLAVLHRFQRLRFHIQIPRLPGWHDQES